MQAGKPSDVRSKDAWDDVSEFSMQ
jgi:hypothetical protein